MSDKPATTLAHGRRPRTGLLGGAALLALLAQAGDATAAVRTCKPLVIGAAREAATELEAKKLALESWLGLAQQYGAGYTRWQIATNTALNCRRLPSGVHQCQAAGAPCTITQAPPPGWKPNRKGVET